MILQSASVFMKRSGHQQQLKGKQPVPLSLLFLLLQGQSVKQCWPHMELTFLMPQPATRSEKSVSQSFDSDLIYFCL